LNHHERELFRLQELESNVKSIYAKYERSQRGKAVAEAIAGWTPNSAGEYNGQNLTNTKSRKNAPSGFDV
jgi:hypothetical protein